MARMRKEKKDIGIQISTGYCVDKEEKKPRYLLFISQMILLTGSALSGIFGFITAMDAEVYNTKLILFTCIFAVFFLVSLTCKRVSHVVIVSSIFIFLLYIYENLDHYFEGIFHLENVVVRAINEYFDTNHLYYIVAQEDGHYDLTFLFIVISFLLCLVGAISIQRAHMQYGYLLLQLAIIIIPCIFGRLPNTPMFTMYIICIIGLIQLIAANRGQKRRALNNRQREYAMGVSFTCMILIATLVVGFNHGFKQEKYEELPILDWKESFTNYLEELRKQEGGIDPGFRKRDYSIGGLSGGALDLNNGRIRFNHKTQLVVKMTRPQSGFFLKGYAGANYEGNSWSEVTQSQIGTYQPLIKAIESGYFLPDNFIIERYGQNKNNIDKGHWVFPKGRLSIEYVNANMNYLYYPYYTWFDSSSVKNLNAEAPLIFGEEYVRPTKKKQKYSMIFYEPPKSIGELEKKCELGGLGYYFSSVGDANIRRSDDSVLSYDAYVDEVYLTVPEEGLERLVAEFSEYGRQLRLMGTEKDSLTTVTNAISFVENYLQNAATYSLTPGKTPKDQDYIEYFLYENHKGYCAHYASAATIMLRLLGVPTRYVEGYYVSDDLIKKAKSEKAENQEEHQIEINVDDSCAHAWVEVYIHGYGWYPVDVTGISDVEEQQETITQMPTPTPQVEKPTPEPSKKPEQEKAPKTKKEVKTKKQSPVVRVILTILVVVFTVAIIVIGFHKYRLEYWSKYLRKQNKSDICILWYLRMLDLKSEGKGVDGIDFSYSEEQYESLASICNGASYEEYDLLHSIYLKAAYSNEIIGEDEFELMKDRVRKEYYRYLVGCSRRRRIWHRFYRTLPF